MSMRLIFACSLAVPLLLSTTSRADDPLERGQDEGRQAALDRDEGRQAALERDVAPSRAELRRMKERAWSPPFAVSLHGGMSGPYGLGGLSFEAAPVRYFVLEVGAGSGVYGLQAGLGGRARLPLTRGFALSLESGLSTGAFERDGASCVPLTPCAAVGSLHRRVWDQAVWARVAPGVEGRAAGWFQWRVYGGVQALLNPLAAECRIEPGSAARCDTDGVLLPFVSAAFGYYFGPT